MTGLGFFASSTPV